jgi:Leucine-rich repeat (LRR) protein
LIKLDTIYLNETTFRGPNNLQTLEIASNQLTWLDETIFDGLINLELLNLSRNKIKSIDGLFKDLFNLKKNCNF